MNLSDVIERLTVIILSEYDVKLRAAEPIAKALDLDSLEVLELVLLFEDEWPEIEGVFDDPGADLGTVSQLAEKIIHEINKGS